MELTDPALLPQLQLIRPITKILANNPAIEIGETEKNNLAFLMNEE